MEKKIIVQSLNKTFMYGREVGLSGEEGDIGYPRLDLHMFDLQQDECQVNHLPSLFEFVPATTMVSVDDYLYLFSGRKFSIIDDYDGFIQHITEPPQAIQKIFLGGSRLDLLSVDQSQARVWSPVNIPIASSGEASCTSLMGKIYSFGSSKLEPWVFDPHVGRWNSFPKLPCHLDGCARSHPANPDPGRRRIMVHLFRGQLSSPSLYAFYPLKQRWKLISYDFREWTPVAAVVGKVIYFHGRKYPSVLRAFDMGTRKWLTVTWKSRFPDNNLKTVYHALLPLGNRVLCLANWVRVYDSEHETKIRFYKFQVEHNPGDATVCLVPISSPFGMIRGECEVHELIAV